MEKYILILRRITLGFNWVALIIMLPLMSITVSVAVFMRYVVQRPIIGADEITGLLMLILYFFSLAHCWNEDGHIRSEIIISHLDKRWKLFSDIFASTAVLIFSIPFIYALTKYMLFYYKIHRVTLDTDIQLWPFWAIAVFGTLLLILSILLTLINLIMKLKKNGS